MRMNKMVKQLFTWLAVIVATMVLPADAEEAGKSSRVRPNVVFIMADDQGYGEAGSFNPECGIPTPGIDRLAREGMRFTDAHSASAVCTPTRYALLTGRYAWRTRLQNGVLRTGVAPLIDESTLTVQGFLKQQGYRTACIGKWHLGFSYTLPPGTSFTKPKGEESAAPVGSRVLEGPTARGFDEFQGFHHAGEMRSWIEQDVVTENFESSAEMLPRLGERSIAYILERGEKKDGPFFLYIPLSSPHTPIVPTEEWKGKSGLGAYSDFVMQTDDVVKQILAALDEAELTKDTLVFFTADNGTSPHGADLPAMRKKGYDPLGGLRGSKADLWEGGHRVPFVARWPGVIEPGSTSDDAICHNNLMATMADILGVPLPDDAGVDSFSIRTLLEGQVPEAPTHPLVIHHSVSGRFAIRQGPWKLIACQGSGGWSKGDDGMPAQLYNLSTNRAEENNQITSQPDIALRLADLLEKAVEDGRTRAGPKQENDVPVKIWKGNNGGRPALLREDSLGS